jgi:hypothetical protein
MIGTFGVKRPCSRRTMKGVPWTIAQSQSLTDAACRRTRTSPAFGAGRGTSFSSRTSADP